MTIKADRPANTQRIEVYWMDHEHAEFDELIEDRPNELVVGFDMGLYEQTVRHIPKHTIRSWRMLDALDAKERPDLSGQGAL